MKCKYCGTENEGGYKYCEKCGTPLYIPSALVTSSTPDLASTKDSFTKKKSRARIAMIAGVAAVLLFLFCFIFLFVATTLSPSLFTAQLSEPTRAPSRTLFPTIPSLPPALATMTPTLSLLSGLNASEIEYTIALAKIVNTYASAMEQIGKQMIDASDNPTLIADGDWRLGTALNMAIVKNNGTELRKLTPPPSFSGVHKDAVEASQHYDKAMDFLATALDKIDGKKLEEALKELNLGKAAITRVTDKLKNRK